MQTILRQSLGTLAFLPLLVMRNETLALFDSVLTRPSAPDVPGALDDQLDTIGEEVDDSNLH